MNAVGFVQFLLAALFATAAVAKLLDLEGSRRAVAGFGVPRRVAAPLGTLLPVAELATAGMLAAGGLSMTAVWIGGLAALLLLAAFSAAIAVSLAHGQTPDCHCFGQLHSSPAGAGTLARNGAMLTLAALVAGGGEAIAPAVTAVVALALLALAVSRSRSWEARLGDAAGPEGLPPGTPAPEFELPDPSGDAHSLDSLRAFGHPVVLIFSDPNCGPCTELAPKIARWQREHADDLTVAVIERDPNGAGPASPDQHGRHIVLLQRESEVAAMYRAEGTPTAVLVGVDGAIASPVAAGGSQIEALMGQALGGNGWRPPTPPARGLFGFPLRRRELLVRAAGAWAATTAVLAWPLQAVAAIDPRRRAEPCEDIFDCPDPHNMRCRGGRCRCDEDLTRCDPREATTRRCFNLQRSRDHCGRCNHACRGDFPECCEGQCGEFGQTRCNCAGHNCGAGEVCISDPDHPNNFFCFDCQGFGWQRCGNECVTEPEKYRCCGGRLYRKDRLGPGDWRCCGPQGDRRLVNVHEHEQHCGQCGHRCPRDEFCFGGRCRRGCPQGTKRCGNTCVRPRSDPNNCGGCGTKCTGPFDTGECCAGTCCDYNGQTCCPGGCKNTSLDDSNCGACGNVCKPGEYCRFGVCTCPLGMTCG